MLETAPKTTPLRATPHPTLEPVSHTRRPPTLEPIITSLTLRYPFSLIPASHILVTHILSSYFSTSMLLIGMIFGLHIISLPG